MTHDETSVQHTLPYKSLNTPENVRFLLKLLLVKLNFFSYTKWYRILNYCKKCLWFFCFYAQICHSSNYNRPLPGLQCSSQTLTILLAVSFDMLVQCIGCCPEIDFQALGRPFHIFWALFSCISWHFLSKLSLSDTTSPVLNLGLGGKCSMYYPKTSLSAICFGYY